MITNMAMEEDYSEEYIDGEKDAATQSLTELRLEDGSDHEDESSDSGDDAEPPMTIGFVQEPDNPRFLARHFFPSKAGGAPAWLDPVNIPAGDNSCCGFCGEPLQFLMQIYAPIDGKTYAFHRTLFVFTCPSMACLLQDQLEQKKLHGSQAGRSVKVFRSQLPRVNPYYSADPPKHDEIEAPVSSGAPLCFWCGAWKGGKICSGCKFVRYCSRQHQVCHWKKGHATECQTFQSAVAASSNTNGKTNSPKAISRHASEFLWPELEIVDDEEDNYESEDTENVNSKNSLVAKSNNDEEFLREFRGLEASKDQRHWASFQARISRFPDQILRYSRNKKAKVLWPRLEGSLHSKDIPKCNACGGPRMFEFQILPQLLYFLKIKNEDDSFDWGTIVIYSCENSCERNTLGYVEEFAWVQLAS